MIVVTGGAGFIGSNLVRSLVAEGHEVEVVDDSDGVTDRTTLVGVDVAPPTLPAAFLDRIQTSPGRALAGVDAVLHQGACSSTTETDEAFLRANNHEYSVAVLDACQAARVPLVYASSASVYGVGPDFVESIGDERPLNGYARSKASFDQVVHARLPDLVAPVVGLRYFNVYGPGERHKGVMASQVLQLADRVRATGEAPIFGAGEGAGPGGHRRDFIHVDDVVAVVRWFLARGTSGIYNCGTGRCRSFQELAEAVVDTLGRGTVTYVPFPPSLVGHYQAHTEADLTRLRAAGYDGAFLELEDGVARYLSHLAAEERW